MYSIPSAITILLASAVFCSFMKNITVLLENTPFFRGTKILLTDVIWRKDIKKEKEKGQVKGKKKGKTLWENGE
jgi:hypothetical protein